MRIGILKKVSFMKIFFVGMSGEWHCAVLRRPAIGRTSAQGVLPVANIIHSFRINYELQKPINI
jgi:hypothetical protein